MKYWCFLVVFVIFFCVPISSVQSQIVESKIIKKVGETSWRQVTYKMDVVEFIDSNILYQIDSILSSHSYGNWKICDTAKECNTNVSVQKYWDVMISYSDSSDSYELQIMHNTYLGYSDLHIGCMDIGQRLAFVMPGIAYDCSQNIANKKSLSSLIANTTQKRTFTYIKETIGEIELRLDDNALPVFIIAVQDGHCFLIDSHLPQY